MAANNLPQRTKILQTRLLDAGSLPARSEPSTVVFSPEEIRAIEATSSQTMMLPPGAHPSRPPASVPPVVIAEAAPASAIPVALYAVVGAIVLVVAALVGPRALLAQDHTWIAPTVLSKSDARVLDVAAALEKQTARRTQLALQKKELTAQIHALEAGLALETSFRASFEAALRSDLAGRRAEASRLEKLVTEAGDDEATSQALTAKLEVARQRIRLLESALHGAQPVYGALALRREYDRSRLETEKASAEKAALAKALAETEDAITQNDALLASIEASPYRTAVGQDATLGFVPYENAANLRVGAPLMTCRVASLACTQVGRVTELLPGEARGASPISGKESRGQLVRITLTSHEAATRAMLFVGRTR